MTSCFHPFAALYEGIPRDLCMGLYSRRIGKPWSFHQDIRRTWLCSGVTYTLEVCLGLRCMPGGIARFAFDFRDIITALRTRFCMSRNCMSLLHLCHICIDCVISRYMSIMLNGYLKLEDTVDSGICAINTSTHIDCPVSITTSSETCISTRY